MTPGGRVQAAIEVLDAVMRPPTGREGVPADTVLSGYLRNRRYIGSKDRRAITEMIWAALRYRGIATAAGGGQPVNPRGLLAATLAGPFAWSHDDIAAAFNGGTYAPAPLDAEESAGVDAVAAVDAPRYAIANLPSWLADSAADVLGDEDPGAWRALAEEAPTTLRVNPLKSDRENCLAVLRDAGLSAMPTSLSPLGISLASRANLSSLPLFRDGWVEVQDEGSQLAAALVHARSGMAVLDYCAGGGGKALALAAAMDDDGRILATDTNGRRLASLAKRSVRAGATIIDLQAIDDSERLEADAFDRVLVDAPCSGNGAWRRRPEAPWRLSPQDFGQFPEIQQKILTAAAMSVRPGGRLIYVTCSIFRAENDAVVDSFLQDHEMFRRLPASVVWYDVFGSPPPAGMIDGDIVRLLSHKSATDGFFVAIMERTDL